MRIIIAILAFVTLIGVAKAEDSIFPPGAFSSSEKVFTIRETEGQLAAPPTFRTAPCFMPETGKECRPLPRAWTPSKKFESGQSRVG